MLGHWRHLGSAAHVVVAVPNASDWWRAERQQPRQPQRQQQPHPRSSLLLRPRGSPVRMASSVASRNTSVESSNDSAALNVGLGAAKPVRSTCTHAVSSIAASAASATRRWGSQLSGAQLPCCAAAERRSGDAVCAGWVGCRPLLTAVSLQGCPQPLNGVRSGRACVHPSSFAPTSSSSELEGSPPPHWRPVQTSRRASISTTTNFTCRYGENKQASSFRR